MRVCDLAKELRITDDAIIAKLRSLRLKAKDSQQELNAAVVIVLKSELGKSSTAPGALKAKEPSKPAVEPLKDSAKEKVKPSQGPEIKTKQESKEKGKEVKFKKPIKGKEIVAKDKPSKQITPPKKPDITPLIRKVVPAPVELRAKPKFKISDKPFETVKPLAKRKKKPFGTHVKEGPPGMGETVPSAVTIPTKIPEGERTKRQDQNLSTAPFPATEVETKILRDIEVKLPISVKDFAVRIQEKPSSILKKLLQLGIFANINQNLDEDVVKKLAEEFGFNLTKVKTEEEQLVEVHEVEKDDSTLLLLRAPVVTFMGHVDHGKTSLIDRIRKSKVADSEHGGITQHIGAYSINLAKGRITFLDTPGHEAFTSMRARGAHITDLIVLVVAADEGVMPQTEEAIDHARAADVPIVVALNKIDKKNAELDRVKKQLSDRGLIPEDWYTGQGSKTVMVGVSALTGQGIDQLLEMILLEAELLELKANPDKKATGIVVEAHLSQGKGPVATLIVQNGTLKEGDMILVGAYYGRVKAMFDDHERPIQVAGPSMPVEILGLPSVAEA